MSAYIDVRPFVLNAPRYEIGGIILEEAETNPIGSCCIAHCGNALEYT